MARECVDEAESGRGADRPQFREMIDGGSQPNAPFQAILGWKFSRLRVKRENTLAFKSMRRCTSAKVIAITEPCDDFPTGELMETMIESMEGFSRRNRAGKPAAITRLAW